MKLTKPQRRALHRAYMRGMREDGSHPMTYRQFRRTVQPELYSDAIMVPIPWGNYWLGIESDGYAHS